jgi:hypothetical protein
MQSKAKNLFSISADAKTTKGEKLGFLTGILYLAPYNLSGFQVCPMADLAKCADACLNTAGRGAFNSVQKARINKTRFFFEHRNEFMLSLVFSIVQLKRKAEKLGLIPLVRLNGTSDLKWENIGFEFEGKRFNNIMECFPEVQFYDYTKISSRNNIPANYDLTFSYSGVIQFQKYNKKAFNNGMRVAAVFNCKPDEIPASYNGMQVIGGDNSDIRHIEPQGVIVGLYAKGKAKQDKTGFVIQKGQFNA